MSLEGVYSPARHIGIYCCQNNPEPSRVVMLVGQAGVGSNRVKSMHLALLAFKSSWRPRKSVVEH